MDTANFSQQLRVLPTLVKALAEDSTHKFKVSATGHLSVLRGARWSSSKTVLDIDAVQSLADEVGLKAERAVLGPWYLRVLRGADGLTIFGERRLDVPDEPLDSRVHEELLQLSRTGSTGLIAGGVGSNKGALLLWLATQLGRRELVFVSDVPPRDLLEPTATHVFPPSNDRERRDLERLLRAHDCIFWDGISRGDDLVSFTSTPGAHNRWFTIDADTPEALGSRLRTVVSSVGRLRLDSCLFIEVEPDGRPNVASLIRHEPQGWSELLEDGASMADELDAIAPLVSRPAPSAGPDPTVSQATSSERHQQPSPMAGIISPKRAGGSRSGSKIAGADEPPEEPTVTSGQHPTPEELEESQFDQTQGMSVDELLASDELDEEAMLRQSGEIDLQAFVRARNERRQQLADAESEELDEASAPAGLGLEQSSDHAVTNIASGAAVDAMLEEMNRQKAAGNPPTFPDVDPDKLTPPVRDETTALTAVDMDRIRESATDDLAWLLENDMGDADPAPTDELSKDDVEESRADWPESHER